MRAGEGEQCVRAVLATLSAAEIAPTCDAVRAEVREERTPEGIPYIEITPPELAVYERLLGANTVAVCTLRIPTMADTALLGGRPVMTIATSRDEGRSPQCPQVLFRPVCASRPTQPAPEIPTGSHLACEHAHPRREESAATTRPTIQRRSEMSRDDR